MSVSFRLCDLSIRSKLNVAFAALVLLFFALGAAAVQRIVAMDRSTHVLATDYALGISYLSEIRQAVMAYRTGYLRAVVLRDTSPGAADRLDASVRQILDRLAKAEAKYAATVDTAEEKQLYEEFRTKWTKYLEGMAPVHELISKGRFDESLFGVRPLATLGSEIDAALQKDAEYNATMAANLAEQVTAENRWGIRIIVAAVLASIVIASLAGWLLVRAIAVPLRLMTGTMRRLAEHDMTTDVVGVGRGDEIGAMAHAVQMFKESMAEGKRLAAERAAKQTVREQRAAKLDVLVHEFEAKVAGWFGRWLRLLSRWRRQHGRCRRPPFRPVIGRPRLAVRQKLRAPTLRPSPPPRKSSRSRSARSAGRLISRRKSPARQWSLHSGPTRSCMPWLTERRRLAT